MKKIANNDSRYKWVFSIYANVFWTLLTIIILVLVFTYDRKGIRTVNELQTYGREKQSQGKASEAIELYKSAYTHQRASNRKKGELALQIADIYLNDFGNEGEANKWYTNAKKLSPRVFNSSKNVDNNHANILTFHELSSVNSHQDLLLPKPVSFSKGHTVASCQGVPITDNEIKQYYKIDDLTSGIVTQYLEDELLFQEAIVRGFDRNEEVLEEFYHFERQELINAYLASVDTDTTAARSALLNRLNANSVIKYSN